MSHCPKFLFLSLGFASIIFASCEKRYEKKTSINISTQIASSTKATDSEFEQGDKVSIFIVNYEGTKPGTFNSKGNYVDNTAFTLSSGKWVPSSEIYWKDNETKADFYCYYPYQDDISNVAMLRFAVNKDQSNIANYKASDFLYGFSKGIAPTPNPVNITVNHLMSNLIVVLQAGKGYNEAALVDAQVKILGLKINSNINLVDGTLAAIGDIAEIIPLKESTQYRALVVPQEVSNTQLISIKIGDNTYYLTQSIKLEANKQHKATITINKTSEGINIGIGDWDIDDQDYGGIVE